MTLFPVVLSGVGGILVYSAVKGYSPVDVVKYGLGGPKPMPVYTSGYTGPPPNTPPYLQRGKNGQEIPHNHTPANGYGPASFPYNGNPTTDTPPASTIASV